MALNGIPLEKEDIEMKVFKVLRYILAWLALAFTIMIAVLIHGIEWCSVDTSSGTYTYHKVYLDVDHAKEWFSERLGN